MMFRRQEEIVRARDRLYAKLPLRISRVHYFGVTCTKCRIPMTELKGHVYHKQRKWRCPQCGKVKMQKPK